MANRVIHMGPSSLEHSELPLKELARFPGESTLPRVPGEQSEYFSQPQGETTTSVQV